MHRNRVLRSGFTLIEILCVVVILGIASALIIPQIGSRDDIKASSAARMLVSDVLYAQNLAISRQQKHYLQFVGQQYTVMAGDPLTAITHPITKNTYAVGFGAGTPGLEGVRIDAVSFGGTTMLGFDDLGVPFGYDGITETPLAAAGTITIRSGSHTLTISIEPFTGETSVQ